MTASETSYELHRYQSALRQALPEWACRAGADEESLTRLQQGFAPLHLPGELLDLLRAMDGELTEEYTLLGNPPLLSCRDILAETASRRAFTESDDDLLPWCPSWVVIGSDGHAFHAVVAHPHAVERAAVIDLSYGNQDYPVKASSLTGLVAAAADVWERGDLSVDYSKPDWQERGRALYQLEQRALRDKERQYPGQDGWRSGDGISPYSQAWPVDWSREHRPTTASTWEPEPLGALRRGREAVVQVRIMDRIGTYLRIGDATSAVWADLPMGHELGRSLTVDMSTILAVQNRQDQAEMIAEAEPVVGPVDQLLQVTGVLAIGAYGALPSGHAET